MSELLASHSSKMSHMNSLRAAVSDLPSTRSSFKASCASKSIKSDLKKSTSLLSKLRELPSQPASSPPPTSPG